MKGVVSLKDILQAYGVAGEKSEAEAETAEVHTSTRLVPGVIAAGLAVLLVIGFINYYYRSERSQRSAEYYKTGNELLQQGRDDEAVQQFRDALSASGWKRAIPAGLGIGAGEGSAPGGSRGLPECAVEGAIRKMRWQIWARRRLRWHKAKPRMR